MNLTNKIYQHSLNLPEEAAREALDFIEFLEVRYTRKLSSHPHRQPEWRESVLALAGVLDDDFPDDIDEDDLPEDTLRETL